MPNEFYGDDKALVQCILYFFIYFLLRTTNGPYAARIQYALTKQLLYQYFISFFKHLCLLIQVNE